MERDEMQAAVASVIGEIMEVGNQVKAGTDRLIALFNVLEAYYELDPTLRDDGNSWRDLVDGSKELIGTLREVTDGGAAAFRGTAAVDVVLSRKAGEWLTVAAVVDDLANRGWLPRSKNPEAAVRTALERMTQAGAIDKIKEPDGRVLYSKPEREDEGLDDGRVD